MTSTAASARTFGMKTRVCSWICVTAWKTDTIRPTTSPTPSTGSATLKASVSAAVERLTTTSWSISGSSGAIRGCGELPEGPLVKALHEGSGDEVPAVDEDEEQDLERERDEDGWQHHH